MEDKKWTVSPMGVSLINTKTAEQLAFISNEELEDKSIIEILMIGLSKTR